MRLAHHALLAHVDPDRWAAVLFHLSFGVVGGLGWSSLGLGGQW